MKISQLAEFVADRMLGRNAISRTFFATHARPLADFARTSSERLFAGGRLLAFGRGPQVTDAQHVAVEFVHPGIVGKPALPALDLSWDFPRSLPVLVQPSDLVIGLAPPEGDAQLTQAVQLARARGALTLAIPADGGADLQLPAASADPFVHQELLMVIYHVLWEAVHIFGEHRGMGHDVGRAGFLYPFLESGSDTNADLASVVATQIEDKARQGEELRTKCADNDSGGIAEAAAAIAERIAAGGKIVSFGNGGSATAASDLAQDCVTPPKPDMRPLPAVSLAWDAASISAVANDVNAEAIFLRQLISHGRAEDVAIGISTSGSSANVNAALAEARKRGLLTISLVGRDGGLMAEPGQADFAFVVPSESVHRIQEVQATISHVLREAVDAVLQP